jgi:hypothetical protein
MIGKTIHGQSFGSLCRYVIRPGAVYLGGNCLGRNPAELTEEFLLLQSLRPALKKPVVHLVGALAPGESMTDEKMFELAVRLIEEQGYGHSLTSIWRHLDGATHHFHIITSLVDTDGNTINQSYERYRMKRTCRSLEREFGLQAVSNVRSPEKPTPIVPPVEPDGLDVELPSITTIVRDAFSAQIRAAIPNCKTFADLALALHEKGIAMVPQVHSESGLLYGLGFRMESGPLQGTYLPGSKIPGGFSPSKLISRHGISFEFGRDMPVLLDPKPIAIVIKNEPPVQPKPRRKKKGERQHARHQRRNPRSEPATEICPWIPRGREQCASPTSGGTKSPRGLASDFLGRNLGWASPSAFARQSLPPLFGPGHGWVARPR